MGDEEKKKCEEKYSNLPQLTYVGQYGEMWHGTIRQYKRTAINFYEMYDHCRLVHFGSKLTSLKIKKNSVTLENKSRSVLEYIRILRSQ